MHSAYIKCAVNAIDVLRRVPRVCLLARETRNSVEVKGGFRKPVQRRSERRRGGKDTTLPCDARHPRPRPLRSLGPTGRRGRRRRIGGEGVCAPQHEKPSTRTHTHARLQETQCMKFNKKVAMFVDRDVIPSNSCSRDPIDAFFLVPFETFYPKNVIES